MTATTIGALGSNWRGDVTPAGAIEPWDGSPVLDWAIAADDRWHRPADEVAVRQQRIDGTPVLETRVKVPGGDAVQRIWVAADHGGATLVEVTNESPLPLAVAFTRGDLLTARPPTDVPIEGIDLPAGSIVLPIGHRSAVTVALAHEPSGAGGRPGDWSPSDAVVRGWLTFAEQAGRLDLPDERFVEAVTAARCDALLNGVDGADGAVARLLTFVELTRLGQPPTDRDVVLEVADAVEVALRDDAADWITSAALDGAAHVLAGLGERRAVADLQRMISRRSDAPAAPEPADDLPSGIAAIAAVERRLAAPVGGVVELFPGGIPTAWHGQSIEGHGLLAGPTSSLSFGVRWHGENPAVLWDVTGPAVALRARAVDPGWSTGEARGETLLRLPNASVPEAPGGLSDPVSESPTSFS